MTKCRHCGSVTGYFVFDVCERCQADGKDSRVSAPKSGRAQAIEPLIESGRVFRDDFLASMPRARLLSDAEAESMDREEVETLAVRESRWLDEQGVTGYSLVIPEGSPLSKVPHIRHDATGARLVDFPPTREGRRTARNVHAVNVAAGRPERTVWLHCGGCDIEHEADEVIVAGHRCPLCNWTLTAKLQPPTLCEWLGDRVSELGRWADVLREHPVPAGWATTVTWEAKHGGGWLLVAGGKRFDATDVIYAIGSWPMDPYAADSEMLQMALFTRHPDVKPEPKPASFPWDPYPELV